MQFSGIDHAKCARRDSISARKGLNVVPLVFRASPQAARGAVAESVGSLADDTEGAIKAINAMQPAGAKPLTADDVWLHYVEAANQNFIQKYWMFFSQRSLKNFAADAAAGVAFMNSHRTGDVSTPSELPLGNTFGGRYELMSDGTARTMIGVFMRRGVHPNGSGGPSTDDMHMQIEAGIQRDDSVGVPAGGKSICAVCENPLSARDENGQYLCTHVPGTPRNMSAEDRKRMRALGVPDGYAAFILDDAHLAEVSAVYSGAVPGAGVRKVLVLGRQHGLSELEMQQARSAYGDLLGKDFGMDDTTNKALEDIVANGTSKALARRDRAAEPPASNTNQAPTVQAGESPELLTLRATVARMEKQLRDERSTTKAKDLAERLRGEDKVTPNELRPLRAYASAVYALCEQYPDMVKMTSADGAEITLAAGLDAVFAARSPLRLVGQYIPESYGDLTPLNDASGGDKESDLLLGEVNKILAQDTRKGGGK